ncbi:hypothetical protein Tco_0797564 [Tanacetum coccineum]
MNSKFQMSMMGQMSFFLGLQLLKSPKASILTNKNMLLETLKCGIIAVMLNSRRSKRREVLHFLEIDWLEAESSKITKVQLLLAVTMSSTLDQSTSTYVTISSESKWKIEWLNSTSWKRTINLRTFSQKHYQENGSNFFLPTLGRKNTMAEQNVPAQAPTRTDEQIVPRSQWLQIGKSNLLFDAQKIQKNPIFQIYVDIFASDLLRIGLDITPVDPAHPFELPPTGDTVIDFEKFSRVLKPGRICGDKPRHPVLQMLWGIVTQTNVDHAELLWEEFTQGFRTILLHTSSPIASPERPKKKVSSLSFIPSAFT